MKPFYTSPADRAVLLLIKEGKPVPPPQALRITKLVRRGLVMASPLWNSQHWLLTPAGEEQIA